jgi:hypothetical protein
MNSAEKSSALTLPTHWATRAKFIYIKVKKIIDFYVNIRFLLTNELVWIIIATHSKQIVVLQGDGSSESKQEL